MGTSNFAYKDTLYAVEIEDEFDVENLAENIHELMNDLDKTAKSKNKNLELDIYALNKPEWNKSNSRIERNFSSKHHGDVRVKSTFMGIDLDLTLQVLIRNGYYEHVNIDYDWMLEVEGLESCEDEDAAFILEWLDTDHLPAGLVAMNTKNLDKRLDGMKALALEAYHHIGKKLGTEYNMTARFSNGETMFAQAELKTKKLEHLVIKPLPAKVA